MNYIVYGSEFCPRCENATKELELMGHIVYHRDLEALREPTDDWRDNWDERCDVTADNAMRNLELPSIRCMDTGEWFDYDDICCH